MPAHTRRQTDVEPTEEPGLGLMPPSLRLMLLEARAPWEAMAMAAVSPWLSRMPPGDGHAVLVCPGLGASDLTTLALRRFLKKLGYQTYG